MTTVDRLLAATTEIWDGYYTHPFAKGIENGTLDKEKFRFYIIQDYLYLEDYAKCFSLGLAKAKSAMLRVAYEEGEAEILTAILSCAYSYELIAKRMVDSRSDCVQDEFYGEWIAGYSAIPGKAVLKISAYPPLLILAGGEAFFLGMRALCCHVLSVVRYISAEATAPSPVANRNAPVPESG